VPPRVEYYFTPFGRKFAETFKFLDALEKRLNRVHRKPSPKPESCLI
jgi:DNA-binding HxlR family transcriptional regulator